MSKRRQFSPEFKREAVDLVRRTGSSSRQVALEIGINLSDSTPTEYPFIFLVHEKSSYA